MHVTAALQRAPTDKQVNCRQHRARWEVSSFAFMCIYTYVYLFLCTQVRKCGTSRAHRCAHVLRPENNFGCHRSGAVHLFLETLFVTGPELIG